MSKHIIPGHVRAYTWWITVVLAGLTLLVTRSFGPTIGVVLLVLGMFLGDQATHLGQENHQGVQSTWIERQMQSHKRLFILLGLVVSITGLLLMVTT